MHYANCHFEPLGHMIDGGGCCSDMHPLLNDIGCSLCQFIFWFSKQLVSPIMQQFMAGIGVTLMILSFDVTKFLKPSLLSTWKPEARLEGALSVSVDRGIWVNGIK
ncbi:hypothetical protein HKD37_19G054470 [Glycine soja]